MAQRQFRSDDTDKWKYGFGTGSAGNGSINTSTDAPIDSACSGTSGTTSLTATNASFATGQLILIHQTRGTGAGNWELNKISSYTAGTITTAHALCNTYTNSGASVAQVLVMTEYNDLTINSGQTLTAKAWNGTVGGIIAKFVKGTCTVTGNITAVGKGFAGGALQTGSDNFQSYNAEGTGGATSLTRNANGNGGGGGYKAYGSSGAGGAGGGHASNGGNPANTTYGGIAGNISGVASLTVMTLGGAGGGGPKYGSDNTNGRAGSGIVLIIANSISVSGLLNVNGIDGANAASYDSGCGGASAGSSVLLKCKTAALGTNLITASGGTGGINTTISNGNSGSGSVGRIHLDYKTSYTGTTNPTLDYTQDATLDYLASSNFFAFFS